MVITNTSQVIAKKGDVLHPLVNRGIWSLILVLRGSAYCSAGLKEWVLSNRSILILPPSMDICILPTEDYEHIFIEMNEQILPGKDQFFCLYDDEMQTGAIILRTICRLLRDKSENYRAVAEPLSEGQLRQVAKMVNRN